MQDELVQRAQRGDHEAFGVLATEAYDRLYRMAQRILHDADCAFHGFRTVSPRVFGHLASEAVERPT